MSVIDLAEAKTHLDITTDDDDDELLAVIDSAEAAIVQRVGPLTATDATARVVGYSWGLYLPQYPAISLTSVTPVNGTPLDLSTLYLDGRAGAVSRNDGSRFTSPAYDVAYVAGRDPVPTDLVFAVKELTRHMWETQRGAASVANAYLDDNVGVGLHGMALALPGGAYTFPIRIMELLAPHLPNVIGA